MTVRNRFRWIMAFLGAIVGAFLLALGLPPSFQLSVEDLVSYNRLSNAEYFVGTAVGIAGTEPEESKALRSLVNRDSGGKAFKWLLLTGTPAGRLYALLGLRHTNPFFFWVAVQPFRVWPGEVETIFGCVGKRMEMRELVETSGENPVRLKNGESINDWWKRRKSGVAVDVDILGGGNTSMFVDFDELRAPFPGDR